MTDYRDPSHLDPNGNFSITQLVKFIREKVFGIDVREAFAKALEKVYEDASKEGNANMEVSQARGLFGLLKDRLDDVDINVINKINRGENESITKNMLSHSLLEEIAGKEINVDVNTSMISDGAVTYPKIAKKYNMSNEFAWQSSMYVQGEVNGKISIVANDNRDVVKIPINAKGTMELQILDPELGQVVFATTADGETRAFRQQFSELPAFNRNGYTYMNGILTLDCETIRHNLPDRYIYLTVLKTNKDNFFVFAKGGFDLPEYYDIDQYSHKTLTQLSEEFNTFVKNKKQVDNTLLAGYVRETGALYTQANATMSYLKYIDIPKHGTLELTKPNLTQGQTIVMEDANGLCFQAYDYQHATGAKSVSFLTLKNNRMIIDFDILFKLFPKTNSLYISYQTAQLNDLVEVPRDNYLSRDIFPNINFKDTESLKMIRLPKMMGIVDEYYNVNLQNLFYQRQNNLMASANVQADNIEEKVTASKTITILQNGTVMNELKILGKNNTLTSSTILGIGESTLNSKVYRKALHEWFNARNITATFVGSRGAGTAEDPKHDGWSGWTTNMFVNQPTGALNYPNPFYNPSKSKFDYAYYKLQKNIPDPDSIVFSLGINDANTISNDQTIANLLYMIEDIKLTLPNVKFVLSLPNTPNSFDPYYSQLHNTRLNIKQLVNVLVENFADKEDENIFISWGGFAIDPLYDMQHEERAVSVFNSNDTLLFGATRITEDNSDGNVHPAESGYVKKANLDAQAILYALN